MEWERVEWKVEWRAVQWSDVECSKLGLSGGMGGVSAVQAVQ